MLIIKTYKEKQEEIRLQEINTQITEAKVYLASTDFYMTVDKYAELDGFATIFESGKGSLYESVFILEDGKRVGCVSSFYHANFNALKSNLKENLVDISEMESALKRENA